MMVGYDGGFGSAPCSRGDVLITHWLFKECAVVGKIQMEGNH